MNKMTLAAEFESVKPKMIQFTKEELVVFRKRIEDEFKENIALWLSKQRNDIPATGEEFAAALRIKE